MSKYLKKFQSHVDYSAYSADTANFILPNVSICVQEGDVHYNPSGVVPPTPTSCISAITMAGEEVETPYCDDGGSILHFSRPVSFEELQNLLIEADSEDCDTPNPTVLQPSVEEDCIRWYIPNRGGDSIAIDKFNGTVDSVQIWHGDYAVYYNRIYLE